MKISIGQINPVMGDFESNLALIKSYWEKGKEFDIVVFPELSVCGYNPQDLALREDFIVACERSINNLVDYSKNIKTAAIVGSIRKKGGYSYNSAFLIQNGNIIHIHDKISLPNYGVFDEKRLFASGDGVGDFFFKGYKSAIMICEDIWDETLVASLKDKDLQYIFIINASPYTKTKAQERSLVLSRLQKYTGANLIYVNQVGLQDSVLYDGSSKVIDEYGNLLTEAPFFQEEIIFYETGAKSEIREEVSKEEELYNALLFALKDYLKKNNIEKTLLGFSSGIDSTLSALLSFDAIGKENTKLVALPSKFNSQDTYNDTKDFENQNKTKVDIIPINNIYNEMLELVSSSIDHSLMNQNLQSRIRGVILMAISNKERSLLLSTGNKSELATGYATIYGDMNGGYNLLKDLYKTEIYNLAKWRNENIPKNSKHNIHKPIPINIINKDPSAELSYNQKDTDSLPPYDVLDTILYNYIDMSKSKDEIIKLGYSSEIVDQVLNLVRIAQFKRYQSTMGPKISNMSFDLDWRYPITNKYY